MGTGKWLERASSTAKKLAREEFSRDILVKELEQVLVEAVQERYRKIWLSSIVLPISPLTVLGEMYKSVKKNSYQIKIKYFLDRILSPLAFLVILPFFVIIALAIKLEDGCPIFFKQKRPGLKGLLFIIWKFRTMVPNADSLLDRNGCVKNVNRLTRVGKILRFLSLDEIPQIINIMKGEMSFIGPRPALYEHLERYTEGQKKRFSMKPGITGLAQIYGRNTLEWSKRIEYDIRYIENYSIWLDIKILFKTIKVVILREGIVLDRNPEQVDDLQDQ